MGTSRVQNDLNNAVKSPNNLISSDGRVFFSGSHFASGTEVWVSDGTDAGTIRGRRHQSGSTVVLAAVSHSRRHRESASAPPTSTTTRSRGSRTALRRAPSGCATSTPRAVARLTICNVGGWSALPDGHGAPRSAPNRTSSAPPVPTSSCSASAARPTTRPWRRGTERPRCSARRSTSSRTTDRRGHVGLLYLGIAGLPAAPVPPFMQGGCDWGRPVGGHWNQRRQHVGVEPFAVTHHSQSVRARRRSSARADGVARPAVSSSDSAVERTTASARRSGAALVVTGG